MIRAVFFDFGGVIGRLDRAEIRSMETRYGLPEGGLLQALYGTPEWNDVQLGRRPEAEWLEAVARKLDEMAGRPIPGIREEWVQMWNHLDRDVLQLVASLKPSYKVGVLSNSTLRLEKELLQANGIFDLFDAVVNSARVGVAKPDVRIYEIAARAVDVAPQACVHIDDLPHNVEGAREAGFSAVHHTGDYPALERELRALGVEW